MKRTFGTLVILALASASSVLAQWELGGFGGFGLSNNLTASGIVGSATTGLRNGAAWGLVGGHSGRYLGGEIRYTSREGDLKLKQGGTDVTFQSRSNTVHYDMLLHVKDQRSPVRPFIAFGGGVRRYDGNGRESAVQPLSSFVLLTSTQQTTPLVSLGGGVKAMLGNHVIVRAEARDLMTPTPKNLLTPAPGASLSGWIHDVVPMIGISFTF